MSTNGSFIATTLQPFFSKDARKTSLPIRPKPLIPIFNDMISNINLLQFENKFPPEKKIN